MKSSQLLAREMVEAVEHPSRRSPKTRIAAFVVWAGFAYGLGACSVDLSCVETATCTPLPDDAGKDQTTGDGSRLDSSQKDANSADGFDVASDRPVNDVSASDRIDAPTVDTSNDARTSNDAPTSDGPAQDGETKPPNQDGGRDVSVSVDASNTADVKMADSSGLDPDSSSPIDATSELPIDAGRTSDARSNDVFDSSDVIDACKKNECGGCTVLTGTPGSSCGACGTYACNGMGGVTCNDPGRNACNGCAVLSAAPGARCGSCGTYACNGTDSVTCTNDAGLNACDGCGSLAGTPGAKCGACGTYVCSGDKASVFCDHPDPLKVTQLAAGYFHTCALLSNGAVRCWGYNANGQLGDNSTVTRLIPTGDVLTGVVAVGAGWGHTCAVMSSGGLRCWGFNGNGELGDGLGGTGTTDYDRHAPPTSDIAGLAAVSAVSLGTDQTCAISGGNAYCWGANYAGQLGDMGPARNAPGAALLGGVSSIGAGQAVTCAMSGGSPGCWGQSAADFQLASLFGSTYIMPPRGGYGCAVDGQGTLRCFYGTQLVQLPLANVTSVGVGRGHVCAVAGGDVRCWGANNWGQIGEPSSSTTERMNPDGPVVVQGAVAVVAGNEYSCALLASGAVRCWGMIYASTPVESPPADVTGFCQ